jgi:hypothetical protein
MIRRSASRLSHNASAEHFRIPSFSRRNFDYSPIEAGFANTKQRNLQNSTEKGPASSRTSRLFSALRPTPPTGPLEKPSSAPASRQLAPLHENSSTEGKSTGFFVHHRNGSRSDQRNGQSSPRTTDSGRISVSVVEEDVRDGAVPRVKEGDAPPTTSAKALDVLIGLPTDAPPKAVSTLTGALQCKIVLLTAANTSLSTY